MRLCVSYDSQNKHRLFPYTTLTVFFCNRDGMCLLRGTKGSELQVGHSVPSTAEVKNE
jgi:hypothetical protein